MKVIQVRGILISAKRWCGPCRALKPLMEEVHQKVSNDVDYFLVDVDELFNNSDAASLAEVIHWF